MESMTLVALGNFIFCIIRTLWAVKKRRLIAVGWLLITYHSFFLLFLVMEGPFVRYKGFTGDFISITGSTINEVCIFAMLFNLVFALSEAIVFALFKPPRPLVWTLPKGDSAVTQMILVYGVFLIVGASQYGLKMYGLGYRDYVEYAGSNWSVVFFWAGAPVVTLLMLQKRYMWALVAVVPFLVMAFYLHIRSFLLLSLIPAAIILMAQQFGKESPARAIRKFTLALLTIVALSVTSGVIMQQKTGKADLPDSGLVYGMSIVFDAETRHPQWFGFNSLVKYGLNLINPFVKVATALGWASKPPDIIDTPVYMANQVDGVPLNSGVYFHYPTLWYSDAYVSFAWYGLWLAVLWGAVMSLFESIVMRSTLHLALLLPFFSWHTYTLIRGAIAGATVPFAYSFYLVLLVAVIVFVLNSSKATPIKQFSINSRSR